MLDVLRPGIDASHSCSTCKPGPDGVPGVGWALLAVGAFVLLIGICVLLFESRSEPEPEPEPAASEPTPVMDAVQREDLERRAAQNPESEKETTSDTALGGTLVGLGVVAAVFGLFIVGITGSRVDDDKNQLRMAAANLLSGAVDGPGVCRLSAAYAPRDFPSSSASSPFTPSPTTCADSPRDYAQENDSLNPGVFLPVEYVFSPSFTANGEVTVHDKQDNRSMCVRVPDTDVAAAAQPTPTLSTDDYGDTATSSPNTLPFFDDVSVDPSPYISSGACPDAPVGSSYSS